MEIGKYISVFLASTVVFKLGMPIAVAAFKLNYLKCIISTTAGGVFSTIIFTYLSDVIIKWWDKLKDKWVTKKGPKKHFTKANRRIIRIKHRFGLIGIAALTPVLLSIPLGAFLAERFYKDKKKVILYTAISLLVWANIYYFILVFGKKAIEALILFF